MNMAHVTLHYWGDNSKHNVTSLTHQQIHTHNQTSLANAEPGGTLTRVGGQCPAYRHLIIHAHTPTPLRAITNTLMPELYSFITHTIVRHRLIYILLTHNNTQY